MRFDAFAHAVKELGTSCFYIELGTREPLGCAQDAADADVFVLHVLYSGNATYLVRSLERELLYGGCIPSTGG